MRGRVVSLVRIVGGLLCVAAVDDGAARAPDAPQPVTAELITEHASIQPEGKTRVGIYFEIEDGWHIYAKEPGDAGLPTQVIWSPNTYVEFGPLHWPPPQRFADPGDIMTYGYTGATVLWSTITSEVPLLVGANWDPDFPPKEVVIDATVQWLACKDICIPGSAKLTLTLPVKSSPPVFSTHAQLFEH